MNQNYNKMLCFVEKNPKKLIKICGISKKKCGFLLLVSIVPLTLLSKTLCLKIPFIFQNSFLLNSPQSFHHDQNEQEFKIQTNKVP